jgi:Fuseless
MTIVTNVVAEEELEMAQQQERDNLVKAAAAAAAQHALLGGESAAAEEQQQHLHHDDPNHPDHHHHHHHHTQRRSGRGSFRHVDEDVEREVTAAAAAAAAAADGAEHADEHRHHPHEHPRGRHSSSSSSSTSPQRRSGRGSFRSTTTAAMEREMEAAAAVAAAAAEKSNIEMTDIPNVAESWSGEAKAAAAGADDDDEVSTTSSTSTVTACTTIQETLANWMMTTVIGILVVSYWRGTWTLLDLWTCDQPETSSLVGGDVFCFAYDFTAPDRIGSGVLTYVISLAVLALGVGMVWAGLWTPKTTTTTKEGGQDDHGDKTGGARTAVPHVSPQRALLRALICYTLGFGTVLQWHGIWYIIDYIFIPHNMAQSFGWGTFLGVFGCFFLFAGNSMLAPPVIFLRDGPSVSGQPPPIAVTLLQSYYALSLPHDQQAPKSPFWLLLLDIFVSFFATPFLVLMYWSSFWQLQDLYFYGFTPEIQDVYVSVFYSALLAMAGMLLGSDDVFYFVNLEKSHWIVKEIVARLRTLFLAIGVLSFWRVVWYLWDLFLGGTTYWSCWLSHWLGIVGLTCLGCLSCITAPPSTLGVDVIPHPEATSEPLFHYVPVPADQLYFLGIARQASAPIFVDMDVTEDVSGGSGNGSGGKKAIPAEENEKSVDF